LSKLVRSRVWYQGVMRKRVRGWGAVVTQMDHGGRGGGVGCEGGEESNDQNKTTDLFRGGAITLSLIVNKRWTKSDGHYSWEKGRATIDSLKRTGDNWDLNGRGLVRVHLFWHHERGCIKGKSPE